MDFLADYFKGKVFVAAAMWMFTVFSVTRSSRSKTSSCFYPSLYPPWVGTMSWTSLHSSIDNPLSRHPVMYFCSFWLLSPLLSLQDWLIWSVGGRLQGRLLWNLKVRQSVNVRHPDTYCVKCQYTIQAKWSYNQTIEAIAPAVCWSMRRNRASLCHAPTPSTCSLWLPTPRTTPFRITVTSQLWYLSRELSRKISRKLGINV